MAVGDQDYYQQVYAPTFANKRQLTFNKMLRLINMIGGHQRRTRHTTVVTPVENADNLTAEQLTAGLFWVHNYDNTYETFSECFDGSNITGLNLFKGWMDYREDPENGRIRSARIPYSAWISDPYWKKPDLSDCGWIWERAYLNADTIKSLVPDAKNESILQRDPSNQSGDGRFLYMPQNNQMYNNSLFAFDEYWTRDFKEVEKLFDTITGEVLDIPKKMTEDQLQLFLYSNRQVQLIKAQMPTVKVQYLVNDIEIWSEVEPYGVELYPYIPFLCYHYPESENYSYRYQGVIRQSRDSQVELNIRRNKFFQMLDSQINSGLIVKEDALVDPEDAFLAGEGRVLYLKETAQMADVQQMNAVQIPPSWFEVVKMLDDDIMQNAGATEELFGENDGTDTSGFMLQLRMGASLTSFQGIFDNLRRSQKLAGNLFVRYMQENFREGLMRRILNDEPTPQFKDQNFQRYDCVVEEGMLTSTQKQMQFIQALQLKQLGFPIPMDYLMEISTFSDKTKLMEYVRQAEEQQSQVAKIQQQQQLEHQALLTRSVEAKAQNDFAAAQEREGRTIANLGLYAERESEKAKNLASASLDQARAIKELAMMDEDILAKQLQSLMFIQQAQKNITSQIDQEGIQVADFVGKDVDVAKTKTELPQKKASQSPEQAEEEKIADLSPV